MQPDFWLLGEHDHGQLVLVLIILIVLTLVLSVPVQVDRWYCFISSFHTIWPLCDWENRGLRWTEWDFMDSQFAVWAMICHLLPNERFWSFLFLTKYWSSASWIIQRWMHILLVVSQVTRWMVERNHSHLKRESVKSESAGLPSDQVDNREPL